eukprot:9178219-Pyramimonas_sp.AAC.1
MREQCSLLNAKRDHSKFTQQRPFMLICDAKELPRFKNDAAAWGQLLQNSPSMICDITKQELIMVPNYDWERAKENVDEQKNETVILPDRKMPKGKAMARPKKEPAVPK